MKIHYRVRTGRMSIELEVGTLKEAFEQIAEIQTIFDAQQLCGMCGDDDVRFRVRTFEAGKYYELYCFGCGAQFDFGQNRDQKGLFPKPRDESSKDENRHGWYKYDPRPRPVPPPGEQGPKKTA